MTRPVLLGTLLAAMVGTAVTPGAARAVHHRRHRHIAAHRAGPVYYGEPGRPYSSSVSPTITCRYADGTPFDPDIIGGPNHVGDGGPAANLGGFDPCEP